LNLALTYTRIDFKSFEGTSLEDLQLTFLHDDVNGDGVRGPLGTPFDFELDQVQVDLDLTLEQDVLALFATYGVTVERGDGLEVEGIEAFDNGELGLPDPPLDHAALPVD
jgi:hypothetical protein